MEKKIITSPYDNRDYEAKEILDFSTDIPMSYQAPNTTVRCQWFSSQCVAFSCTQAISQQEALLNNGNFNLYSTGMLYANREEDDFQGEGWFIRKALKQLHKYGTCLNETFPHNHSYEDEREHFLERQEELLQEASEHKIVNYFRCRNEDEIKRCILQRGGCIISIDNYNKFYFRPHYKKTDTDGQESRGGHALIIVGWTENNEWIVQDSYSIFRPWFGRLRIDFDYPIREYWGITL